MAKAQRGLKIHWSRAVLAGVMTALVAVGMVPIVRAFKIGAGSSPDIHESITGNAITAVMPQADPMFVSNVKSGNYNTDFSHHIDAAFHFDNSTAGDGNGGFTNGFRTIYDMLSRAVIEATACDPNAVCNVNPLFLNPQHGRFADLVADIEDTYASLSGNDGCFNELACPTTDFSLSSAALEVEMGPALLVIGDPDPDPVEKSLFTPLDIEVENFGDVVAEGKNQLDALLGRHCRPAWAGGMCFETLELMAPGDDSFQKLAAHLRILQYEYQAYYAWQHLGHAFHTTQDFFAHSNYIEIAGGRKGPPCDPSSYQAATICDAPLDTNSGRWDAIRLPTDEIQSRLPAFDVAGFVSVFSTVDRTLNNLPSLFGGDANFNHLQTGYYPCGVDADPLGNTGGAAPYNLGFLYCHSATPSGNSSPGMNKDKRYEPSDDSAALGAEHHQINRQNFDWAAISAQRTSVVLFETFLFSLLGPASSNYISVSSANAASQRVGEMAWLKPHRNGVVVANSGLSQLASGPKTSTTGLQVQMQSQLPALSATVSSTGPSSSPVTDTVTVTSGGAPVAGATVSVGHSTFVTDATGVAVITHMACMSGSQVAKVGGTTVPKRVPVPCGWTAMASAPGYQSFSFTLP